MVTRLSNKNRTCHLSACQCAVTAYSRGPRRGMGRMDAITHQPHQFQESLRAQGSLEVRVWKVINKFSLFSSLSLCWVFRAARKLLSVLWHWHAKPAQPLEAGQRGAGAEMEKQVEESATSFQEHRVPVERGPIVIMKHTESTLKTKY